MCVARLAHLRFQRTRQERVQRRELHLQLGVRQLGDLPAQQAKEVVLHAGVCVRGMGMGGARRRGEGKEHLEFRIDAHDGLQVLCAGGAIVQQALVQRGEHAAQGVDHLKEIHVEGLHQQQCFSPFL